MIELVWVLTVVFAGGVAWLVTYILTLGSPQQGGKTKTSALEELALETRETVRIVHWSDTHNFLHDKISLPPGDIFVHSGDFTHHGTRREFKKFNAWLEHISKFYPFRIVVCGNHDTTQMKDVWRKRGGLTAMRALLPAATHVLMHEECTIFGLRIYGSPWQWFQNARYESWYTLSTATCKFESIPPNGVDVLITHGPAKGILDKKIGSPQLLAALDSRNIPLHLFGHIHECRGVFKRSIPNGEALSVNSCACGEVTSAGIRNRPHVIEWDRKTRSFSVVSS